jgi:hypothetical protein
MINHMIIGDLGDEEILLCSHNDGDVVGFYTSDIEKALQNHTHRLRPSVIINIPSPSIPLIYADFSWKMLASALGAWPYINNQD